MEESVTPKTNKEKKIKLAVADDNFIFREGLCRTLEKFPEFSIILNEDDCRTFYHKISGMKSVPDICLLDISMPEGYQVLKELKENFPQIKVLILSMLDNELSIIRTIKIGANGFLLKGCSPEDMHQALLNIAQKGSLSSEKMSLNEQAYHESLLVHLSYQELEMLHLFCTEQTLRQIADTMNLSFKKAEQCRDELFRKLNVSSRIGLVLFALNLGMMPVNNPTV